MRGDVVVKANPAALDSRCVVVNASADRGTGGGVAVVDCWICDVVMSTSSAVVRSSTSGGAIVGNCGSKATILLVCVGTVIVIADVEAEGSWVDVAVTPEKQGTEDWFGKDVENTVEHSFGVWSNYIATLGKTPGDWIDEPEEDGPCTAHYVSSADVFAKHLSV